jgi:3'-phosphoadenosine 5'-phosphosulfate (PAPS) 3'-phosphatase
MRLAAALCCCIAMAASLQPQTVPLHKLLSTCIDAAARGCDRIRRVQESGATDATLKVAGDAKSALTAADLAAQAAVVGALSKAWPGLTIVGEEDEAALDEDFELATPLDDALLDWECTTSVDLSKARVFVDPLDGTREFVEGRLDAVQCLVGVAVGDAPVCGAVGLPFPADGGAPRVIYATSRGSVGPSDAPRAQKRADDALFVIAGDGSDAAQAAAVEAFPGADFAVRGAAGNKLRLVAEGGADVAILHCVTLCGNQILGAPRHRRDAVSVAASARWRGGSRMSTQARRRPGTPAHLLQPSWPPAAGSRTILGHPYHTRAPSGTRWASSRRRHAPPRPTTPPALRCAATPAPWLSLNDMAFEVRRTPPTSRGI